MPPLTKTSPWPFVALGALACMAFVNGASLLFLPVWVVVALYLLWLPTVLSAARRFTSTRVTLSIAAANICIWLLALAAFGHR